MGLENTQPDQELPKKLTPEEIEQSIEKDNSALLSDVNEKIEKKTQIVEDTKNKIDEIRNGFGLPPSDEIPPSVKTEEEAVTKLNQEKERLNYSLMAKNSELIENEMKALTAKTIVDGKKTFKFTLKEDEDRYKKLRKLLLGPSNELNKELDILNKSTEQEDIVVKSEESKKTEVAVVENKQEGYLEVNEKAVLEEMNTSLDKFKKDLEYRYEYGYTKFFDEDSLKEFDTASKNLQEGQTLEKLYESAKELPRLLEYAVDLRINGNVKDDNESLSNISSRVNDLAGKFEDFGNQLTNSTQDIEKKKEIAQYFHIAHDMADQLRQKINRYHEFI